MAVYSVSCPLVPDDDVLRKAASGPVLTCGPLGSRSGMGSIVASRMTGWGSGPLQGHGGPPVRGLRAVRGRVRRHGAGRRGHHEEFESCWGSEKGMEGLPRLLRPRRHGPVGPAPGRGYSVVPYWYGANIFPRTRSVAASALHTLCVPYGPCPVVEGGPFLWERRRNTWPGAGEEDGALSSPSAQKGAARAPQDLGIWWLARRSPSAPTRTSPSSTESGGVAAAWAKWLEVFGKMMVSAVRPSKAMGL